MHSLAASICTTSACTYLIRNALCKMLHYCNKNDSINGAYFLCSVAKEIINFGQYGLKAYGYRRATKVHIQLQVISINQSSIMQEFFFSHQQ